MTGGIVCVYTVHFMFLFLFPFSILHAGASSDVEVATRIARTMITKYAMSEEVSACPPVLVCGLQELQCT